MSDLSITYTVENWSDCLPELIPFTKPHWEELGLDHADVPVDIGFEAYAEHERAGRLHLITVRDYGTLIGYITAIITPMLHYNGTLHAITDLYYLKPDYRKAKIGVKLFQFAERQYRQLGVVKIITATKLHLNHSELFEGLGYRPTELTFTKVIQEKADEEPN